MKRLRRFGVLTAVLALACAVTSAEGLKKITVGPSGADFTSIQAAVDAAPATGAVIRIEPGVYREVVHVDKPGVQFRGNTRNPARVVLVNGNSAANTCGTSCSATLFVTGKDFVATEMTIANDYSKHSDVPSQAVAVKVTGDRAIFRHVRLLGAQDTLYAASDKCMNGQSPCAVKRQYFADCYIEGHVDFLFGDAKAVFDHCEIHSISPCGGRIPDCAEQKQAGAGFRLCVQPLQADGRRGRQECVSWAALAGLLHCHLSEYEDG